MAREVPRVAHNGWRGPRRKDLEVSLPFAEPSEHAERSDEARAIARLTPLAIARDRGARGDSDG